MNQNNIKYPVAYNFRDNVIVPISEVTKENRLNLFCPQCKNNFIAVLNHQTKHFKHKPNSTCSGSLESYLHWLAKELFKLIKEIETPELFIDDLPEKKRQKFQSMYNKTIDDNVPETLRSMFKKGLKKNLTESRKLLIVKCETEKGFTTEIGNIVVDVIIMSQNEAFFIEPFFTNQIDDEKKEKLALINIPTLSLDLLKFIKSYGQNYSAKELKHYLISKNSKKWIYLCDELYDKYIEEYKCYILAETESRQTLINSHQTILNEIATLEMECRKRYKSIGLLSDEIAILKEGISKLEKELPTYN